MDPRGIQGLLLKRLGRLFDSPCVVLIRSELGDERSGPSPYPERASDLGLCGQGRGVFLCDS